MLFSSKRATRALSILAPLTIILGMSSWVNSEELQRYEYTAEKMGVPVSVTFYAKDAAQADEAIAAVWRRFDELNSILSDWDPESEIIRVCREAEETGDFVETSDELYRALRESRLYCELTEGAFDATMSPIVKLWRRSRYFKELPPKSVLDVAKTKVGLNVWELKEKRVKTQKGVRFDVGGIAKGIVMDEALDLLKEFGIDSALINASGDLRLGNPPPGKKGWTVGVASLGEKPAFYRELSNVGVASSGDANRYVEIDGVRYSHIVDPRTGEPLTRRCVATVVAPTGTTADALASALCVLGAEESSRIFDKIKKEGLGDGKPLETLEYVLILVKDHAEEPYDDSNCEFFASSLFQGGRASD